MTLVRGDYCCCSYICIVSKLSNFFQTDDATGKLTGQRGVETCLHEELATEGLALEVMAALSALKLVEAIGGVGV